MNFSQAVVNVLKNYATFSGRALRSEYWHWILFYLLAGWVLGILDAAIFGMPTHMHGAVSPYYSIFVIVTFLPTLAVMVRRLHDINRSGGWIFILLLPVIGMLIMLFWLCSRGTYGANRFGPDPDAGRQLEQQV